jgi:probable HAF family extracellular repeat protein
LVPGGSAFGADINDEGMIAGYADTEAPRSPSTPHHAILINAGQVLDLGVLPGFTLSSANRINRHGHVAGNSNIITPERSRGFLYRDGRMTDLGVLPGDTDSVVLDVNNSDQAVGVSYYNNGGGFILRPVLYNDGAAFDLQSLVVGGADWDPTSGVAVGLNDAGQIIVVAQKVGGRDEGVQRTFLLTPLKTTGNESTASKVD